MGSHGLFLATLFPIPARFISCDPNTIDFPIYRLHNVRYIWEQEGILQRPAVPFIHCKNLLSVKCENQIQNVDHRFHYDAYRLCSSSIIKDLAKHA